jgi:uncharacterized protein YajQ (UPF0234 family)
LRENIAFTCFGLEWRINTILSKDLAKKLVSLIKDNKQLKVSPSIQGDVVRVTCAERDLLQDCIVLVKKSDLGFPMQFINFRD